MAFKLRQTTAEPQHSNETFRLNKRRDRADSAREITQALTWWGNLETSLIKMRKITLLQMIFTSFYSDKTQVWETKKPPDFLPEAITATTIFLDSFFSWQVQRQKGPHYSDTPKDIVQSPVPYHHCLLEMEFQNTSQTTTNNLIYLAFRTVGDMTKGGGGGNPHHTKPQKTHPTLLQKT